MSFTGIGSIFNKKYGQSGLARNVTAALVCEEFDKIMLDIWGEKIKDAAKTIYLKDKVLTVACLSSVVAGELKMRERELVEKVNAKFDGGIVEMLRFLM